MLSRPSSRHSPFDWTMWMIALAWFPVVRSGEWFFGSTDPMDLRDCWCMSDDFGEDVLCTKCGMHISKEVDMML